MELPEEKAMLIASAHEEFLRTGVDRSIKLPGGGMEMVSQVLRIIAVQKKAAERMMTRPEAEEFTKVLSPYMHEGRFDFESQLRYMQDIGAIKVRSWPVGRRAKSITDVELGVVEENATNYREVCDRIEQWLYIQGKVSEEKRLETESLIATYEEEIKVR